MGKKGFQVPKRETTQTKIDMAREALQEIGINYHVPIYRKLRFRRNHGPIKSMGTVPISNKYLCGQLGHLCKELRAHGIAYPWRQS